jgi:hypothetical protein
LGAVWATAMEHAGPERVDDRRGVSGGWRCARSACEVTWVDSVTGPTWPPASVSEPPDGHWPKDETCGRRRRSVELGAVGWTAANTTHRGRRTPPSSSVTNLHSTPSCAVASRCNGGSGRVVGKCAAIPHDVSKSEHFPSRTGQARGVVGYCSNQSPRVATPPETAGAAQRFLQAESLFGGEPPSQGPLRWSLAKRRLEGLRPGRIGAAGSTAAPSGATDAGGRPSGRTTADVGPGLRRRQAAAPGSPLTGLRDRTAPSRPRRSPGLLRSAGAPPFFCRHRLSLRHAPGDADRLADCDGIVRTVALIHHARAGVLGGASAGEWAVRWRGR